MTRSTGGEGGVESETHCVGRSGRYTAKTSVYSFAVYTA